MQNCTLHCSWKHHWTSQRILRLTIFFCIISITENLHHRAVLIFKYVLVRCVCVFVSEFFLPQQAAWTKWTEKKNLANEEFEIMSPFSIVGNIARSVSSFFLRVCALVAFVAFHLSLLEFISMHLSIVSHFPLDFIIIFAYMWICKCVDVSVVSMNGLYRNNNNNNKSMLVWATSSCWGDI